MLQILQYYIVQHYFSLVIPKQLFLNQTEGKSQLQFHIKTVAHFINNTWYCEKLPEKTTNNCPMFHVKGSLCCTF